jgi:hypothetical protein
MHILKMKTNEGILMKGFRILRLFILIFIGVSSLAPSPSNAWNDETHLAVAKAAGYYKWYLAAGADMMKIKAGKIESGNHFFNNVPGSVVTPALIEHQIDRYNREDPDGHLYGAIVHSVRDFGEMKSRGKYAEYHLAFCAHYLGDLTMPLHNMPLSEFSKKYHKEMEQFVNEEGLDTLAEKIRIYPVKIDSETALMKEIARIANISLQLGYRLQTENRLITRAEAYEQLGHGASLFKGILEYLKRSFI